MQKVTPQIHTTTILYKNLEYELEYFIRLGKKGTMLLVHGLGGAKENYWEATKHPELLDYCLIAFDNPGTGNSTYYDDYPLNVDDLTEITKLFIDQMNLQNFILIGTSMGGLVTLHYLKHDIEKKVRAYVNIEGNLTSEDCMFTSKVVPHAYSHFASVIFPQTIQTMRKHASAGYRIIANNLELNTNINAYYHYAFQTVAYSSTGALLEEYIRLKIPRVFIYGDQNCGLSYLPYLQKEGLNTVSILESDHFVFYDNPSALYSCISDFVEIL